MPMHNRYSVFGLTIESEMELPELIASGAEADASVVIGKTPERLENPASSTPWLELKAGRCLQTIDAAGRYYVENGTRIVVEPVAGADGDDLRTFLYDSALAALLQQRGMLALHGAAAVINGKAVAILGGSSTGKSTVALALYERGHLLLADEICAVGLWDGHAAVYPGIPRLCLWKNALEHAGKATETLRPVRRGLQKYSLPVADRFAAAPLPLSRIYILHNHNILSLLSERLAGGNKLEKLIQQQFFLETTSDRTKHFGLCAAAVSTRMTTINCITLPGEADKIADLIETEADA